MRRFRGIGFRGIGVGVAAMGAVLVVHPLPGIVVRPALAQEAAPVSPADHDRIVGVIRDQMAAFGRDDGPAAFGFASPGIQTLFDHDPARFLSMVRQSYQPVYRPRSTAFGPTEMVGGEIVQKVDVLGPDGVRRTALYTMEREADGSWRIAGCALTDAADVGA